MAKGRKKNKLPQFLIKKFKEQMPRIYKEIEVYELNLKNGRLKTNPKISPQFHQ